MRGSTGKHGRVLTEHIRRERIHQSTLTSHKTQDTSQYLFFGKTSARTAAMRPSTRTALTASVVATTDSTEATARIAGTTTAAGGATRTATTVTVAGRLGIKAAVVAIASKIAMPLVQRPYLHSDRVMRVLLTHRIEHRSSRGVKGRGDREADPFLIGRLRVHLLNQTALLQKQIVVLTVFGAVADDLHVDSLPGMPVEALGNGQNRQRRNQSRQQQCNQCAPHSQNNRLMTAIRFLTGHLPRCMSLYARFSMAHSETDVMTTAFP